MKNSVVRSIALALLFAASAVLAQGGAKALAISEAQLQKFAAAYMGIVVVSREYAPKIKAAPGPAEVEALNREAQAKMVNAVTATGLTKEEYIQIVEQLKTDPALMEKANKYLQEKQQQAGE